MWRQRELAKLALATDTFGGRDYDHTCPRQNNPRRRLTYDGARERALQAQVYGARNLARYPEFGRLPQQQAAGAAHRPLQAQARAPRNCCAEESERHASSARVLTPGSLQGPDG